MQPFIGKKVTIHGLNGKGLYTGQVTLQATLRGCNDLYVVAETEFETAIIPWTAIGSITVQKSTDIINTTKGEA